MQATVAAFDPDTSSGDVLLDDGVRLSFSSSALHGSRLRFLRPGQRVRITVEDDVVTRLQIVTLS